MPSASRKSPSSVWEPSFTPWGFVSKKDISKALAVHTIEAIKAVSSMIDGKFEYSSLSHEENQTPIDQDLDFEKLYTEFSTGTEQLKYIKKNVDSAIRKTEADNLFLLPAGNIPPNPSELIASKQMGFLVRYLKKRFDFIVIDSPPVMPATDSILIAPRTEGTVFVMRSGQCRPQNHQGWYRSIQNSPTAHYWNGSQPGGYEERGLLPVL